MSDLNNLPKIVIAAGGTGGHVFPALAVAGGLRERGVDVVWMGTRAGLEARVVPAAGFPMEWVSITGLRGKGALSWLVAPLRLCRALWQSLKILRRHRPGAVLGMGGFVSGPCGLAAWLLRAPLVVHEQNAIAGATNRILARLAAQVLEAFPGAFAPARQAQCVGNPVRPEIAALPDPARRLAGRSGPVRLLVVGGSLGARALNQLLPEALALIPVGQRPEVRHQAGGTIDQAQRRYRQLGLQVELTEFIEDMPAAYAWADLVVCRAGALTVAELAAAGLGSVLIPFAYAVDDHQSENGRYLVEAGAAVMHQEADLTPAMLAETLRPLLADRRCLLDMAAAARGRAWPNARQDIVRSCLTAAGAV